MNENLQNFDDDEKREDDAPVEMLPYTPESTEESVRQSGLAYSAGAVLFGSVAVMLLAGWLLDNYLGTSPGFLVGGIVVGAGIGFFLFFRITSQIFRK
jgi:F0F1-type ATP synthase assembly protein I